jgi:hypothetical protein
MRREQRRNGGLELPVNRASLKESRLLNTAPATLAASVLTDSTAEHYRAGFHNRAMFIAPTVSAATLASSDGFVFAPRRQGVLAGSVFGAAVVTGLVGFGFHLTNVSRRVGGWNSANVFHGAPIAARSRSRWRTLGDRCLSGREEQPIRNDARGRRAASAGLPWRSGASLRSDWLGHREAVRCRCAFHCPRDGRCEAEGRPYLVGE